VGYWPVRLTATFCYFFADQHVSASHPTGLAALGVHILRAQNQVMHVGSQGIYEHPAGHSMSHGIGGYHISLPISAVSKVHTKLLKLLAADRLSFGETDARPRGQNVIQIPEGDDNIQPVLANGIRVAQALGPMYLFTLARCG
jgi:hypothetical protein